jgi:CheY-like chemotaxis protein
MKRKLNCVLLVDDNEPDNFLHKRIIEKVGIANYIGIAENGREALEFIRSKWRFGQTESTACLPELIFLDINMPIMDGWQFLEEFYKIGDVRKTKGVIIILTTSQYPVDLVKANSMPGSIQYRFKPLTVEMLNEIIQQRFPEYI